MSALIEFQNLLQGDASILALAPMQDVTDLRFMRLISGYGSADVYFTEYFRVLPDSRLDPQILASITQNPTGRPVIAQMIGNDIAALVRTARELQQHPVAAIDLNLGCPVPIVYRKCAGGGLLRDPDRIDQILGALREAIAIPFTVKTRIGFDDTAVFDELLPIFARHALDLLTVHARTVKEMYRSAPRYDFVATAVAAMPCPVLANGNIYSAAERRRSPRAHWRARAHDRPRRHSQSRGSSARSARNAAARPSSVPRAATCSNMCTRFTKPSACPVSASPPRSTT